MKANKIVLDFSPDSDHPWTSFLTEKECLPTLKAGINYARQGRVLEIQLAKNRIYARVQGSRNKAYRLDIRFKPLPPEIWDTIISALASKAALSAILLTGKMPIEIETLCQQANFPLFPKQRQDLVADCSCTEMANPCKHAAAVFYMLEQEFGHDPATVFLLRGKSKEELLTELTQKRSLLLQTAASPALSSSNKLTAQTKSSAIAETASLPELLSSYWQSNNKLSATNPAPEQLNSEEEEEEEEEDLSVLGNPPGWPQNLDFASLMTKLHYHISHKIN